MPNVRGELGHEGKVAGLAWRTLCGAVEVATQGLVVRPDSEGLTFQVMMIMLNGEEQSQQLLIKSTVFLLSFG